MPVWITCSNPVTPSPKVSKYYEKLHSSQARKCVRGTTFVLPSPSRSQGEARRRVQSLPPPEKDGSHADVHGSWFGRRRHGAGPAGGGVLRRQDCRGEGGASASSQVGDKIGVARRVFDCWEVFVSLSLCALGGWVCFFGTEFSWNFLFFVIDRANRLTNGAMSLAACLPRCFSCLRVVTADDQSVSPRRFSARCPV